MVDSATWPERGVSRDEFIERVAAEGRARYRDLAWRNIDDAYAVLVSEIMLQQTQVKRVERFWTRWLSAFPTIDALAAASTSDVLEMWQGLGYNRRALALKRTADLCSAELGGCLPQTYDGLLALPGIGPATAAGVMAFAHQQPGVYLETNVRAVFIHELFSSEEKVSDKMLIPLVEQTCPAAPSDLRRERAMSADERSSCGAASSRGDLSSALNAPDPLHGPREWYYALLDYGAHLKATVVNPTRKSAHYVRQSAFEGSRRQKRSWIVRRVLAADSKGISVEHVAEELDRVERGAGRDGVDAAQMASILQDLVQEGFFKRDGDMLLPM